MTKDITPAVFISRPRPARPNGAFTHALRWNGMGCAGNSMYFNGGVHTLSYQRSPSQRSLCVCVCVCECTITLSPCDHRSLSFVPAGTLALLLPRRTDSISSRTYTVSHVDNVTQPRTCTQAGIPRRRHRPVSYTHLTLPTILRV